MTQTAKANPKRRVRRVLFFSLLCLVVLCALTSQMRKREGPSIEIGQVVYSPFISYTTASFMLTNNGTSPIHINFPDVDFVRFETTNGWITEDCRHKQKLSSFFRGDLILRVRGGQWGRAEVPANALRWQAGFRVKPLTAEEMLEPRFGPKLSKPIATVFGSLISEERDQTVWSTIVEMTNTARHAGLPPIH